MDADYIANCVSSQDLWRYPNDKHNLIIRKPDIFYIDDPQLEVIYVPKYHGIFQSGKSFEISGHAQPDRRAGEIIAPGNVVVVFQF